MAESSNSRHRLLSASLRLTGLLGLRGSVVLKAHSCGRPLANAKSERVSEKNFDDRNLTSVGENLGDHFFVAMPRESGRPP